jgi:outer membrane lipoprotein carrier protein
MKRPFPILRSLFAMSAVLLLGHPAAQAQSGQDVLDRIKNKYASIDALRAEFRQITTTPFDETGESISGVIYLSDDKFRVETEGQIIVSNGTTTWIYNAATNQVLINDNTEDETTFSLNRFLFDFDDTYEIASTGRALLGGKEHHMLRLHPKNPDSYFREIMVVMRDSDNLVPRIEVVDVNDTRMVFELKSIELNPPLAPDTFLFTPPEGSEVVDLRSE